MSVCGVHACMSLACCRLHRQALVVGEQVLECVPSTACAASGVQATPT